jgi:hypothetical protein
MLIAMKYLVLPVLTVCFFAACGKNQDDGPKIEASVEVKGDSAADSMQKGLEKAGHEIKKGAKQAQSKLEDAGEAIKDKVEEAKDKLSSDKKAEVEVKVKKD